MLSAHGLKKRYASGQGVYIDTLLIGEGESVALVGPNGSGKSTTVKCLAGLLMPDEGAMRVAGFTVGSHMARQLTGYVSDAAELYPGLSVAEHLRFRAQAYGLRHARDVVTDALDINDIDHLADRRGFELSRGERQRVVLAAARLQGATMYLLDEPTIGLDPVAIVSLAQWIREVVEEGAAALITTHSLELVRAVSSRAVLLSQGNIIKDDYVPEDSNDFEVWRTALLGQQSLWRPKSTHE